MNVSTNLTVNRSCLTNKCRTRRLTKLILILIVYAEFIEIFGYREIFAFLGAILILNEISDFIDK